MPQDVDDFFWRRQQVLHRHAESPGRFTPIHFSKRASDVVSRLESLGYFCEFFEHIWLAPLVLSREGLEQSCHRFWQRLLSQF